MTDSIEMIVAKTLKRLYPNNPDVVLGREARIIVADLREQGIGFIRPMSDDDDPVVLDPGAGYGHTRKDAE